MKSFFMGRLSQKVLELYKAINLLEKKVNISSHYLECISSGIFDLDINNVQQTLGTDETKFIETIQRTKEKLLEYTQKEKEQLWMAEGISKFMDIIRGDTRNKSNFYDSVLSLLVKYTNANQGGLFILNEEEPEHPFLELMACYAYSRKRFKEKRIEIGQGLSGQCFLEKETIQLTDIPNNYVEITSGLGEATPRFLLIVPVKYNDEVFGVIELASFTKMEPVFVSFIERVAESLASVTLNIKNTQKVDQLLQESEEKARLLQVQEENLRQNFEELLATQEEMKRNQMELDRHTELIKFILDNVPFPIFVKDEKGRYTIVNKAEAKLFGLTYKDIIGKDDSVFVTSQEEWKIIQESDERVLEADVPMELPLQHFTTLNGASYIFKTTKIPFVNKVTGKKNILGVSIDLKDKLDLEKKLFREKQISNNNVLINLAGRQRMLSQKIGFYCETLARGKKQNVPILKEAIDLHEHSLQVIKKGGIPNGLKSMEILLPAQESIQAFISIIERIWQPYKKAAEEIIRLATHETLSEQARKDAIENNLSFIEETSEALLKCNDDLMLACMEVYQSKLVETY